jgi:hypothetical protein
MSLEALICQDSKLGNFLRLSERLYGLLEETSELSDHSNMSRSYFFRVGYTTALQYARPEILDLYHAAICRLVSSSFPDARLGRPSELALQQFLTCQVPIGTDEASTESLDFLATLVDALSTSACLSVAAECGQLSSLQSCFYFLTDACELMQKQNFRTPQSIAKTRMSAFYTLLTGAMSGRQPEVLSVFNSTVFPTVSMKNICQFTIDTSNANENAFAQQLYTQTQQLTLTSYAPIFDLHCQFLHRFNEVFPDLCHEYLKKLVDDHLGSDTTQIAKVLQHFPELQAFVGSATQRKQFCALDCLELTQESLKFFNLKFSLTQAEASKQLRAILSAQLHYRQTSAESLRNARESINWLVTTYQLDRAQACEYSTSHSDLLRFSNTNKYTVNEYFQTYEALGCPVSLRTPNSFFDFLNNKPTFNEVLQIPALRQQLRTQALQIFDQLLERSRSASVTYRVHVLCSSLTRTDSDYCVLSSVLSEAICSQLVTSTLEVLKLLPQIVTTVNEATQVYLEDIHHEMTTWPEDEARYAAECQAQLQRCKIHFQNRVQLPTLSTKI